jgi:putative salt-induced outer membrane protein YdiY
MAGRAALSYRRKLGASSELSNDLDYMANFKESSDWRVTNVAALSASVSKVFALKLAHQLYYFHEPVPGKKSTDTTFVASLVVRWPQ